MTKERIAQLRAYANAYRPRAAAVLRECLDEIEKLQHDKQAATNAANRAIKLAQKGRK